MSSYLSCLRRELHFTIRFQGPALKKKAAATADVAGSAVRDKVSDSAAAVAAASGLATKLYLDKLKQGTEAAVDSLKDKASADKVGLSIPLNWVRAGASPVQQTTQCTSAPRF